jgi:hypothetical protein
MFVLRFLFLFVFGSDQAGSRGGHDLAKRDPAVIGGHALVPIRLEAGTQ